MNSKGEPERLMERYRTTLINLARHHVAMLNQADEIRQYVEMNRDAMLAGRRAGLHCRAKVLKQNAWKLKAILDEDKAIMIFFFGTINLNAIANQTVEIEH